MHNDGRYVPVRVHEARYPFLRGVCRSMNFFCGLPLWVVTESGRLPMFSETLRQ